MRGIDIQERIRAPNREQWSTRGEYGPRRQEPSCSRAAGSRRGKGLGRLQEPKAQLAVLGAQGPGIIVDDPAARQEAHEADASGGDADLGGNECLYRHRRNWIEAAAVRGISARRRRMASDPGSTRDIWVGAGDGKNRGHRRRENQGRRRARGTGVRRRRQERGRRRWRLVFRGNRERWGGGLVGTN